MGRRIKDACELARVFGKLKVGAKHTARAGVVRAGVCEEHVHLPGSALRETGPE